MATSGTSGQTRVDLATVLDHVFRRCRIPAARQTPELVTLARENMFFLLNEFAGVGLKLWCVDKIIQGLQLNQEAYFLPLGTVELLDVLWRRTVRLSGVVTSSDLASTAALTDGDLATSLTQSVTGGNVQIDNTVPVAVRHVGLYHKGSATRNLAFETSTDALTWTTRQTTGEASFSEATWYWYDIEPGFATRYFRVRDTLTNAALSLYELYFASDATEIMSSRMNRDDYTNLPRKFTNPGQPLQHWFDRQAFQPVIRVWPSPISAFDQLVIWRQRHVQDVTADLTLEVEIPPRWLEAVISGTAHRVAMEAQESDPQIISTLGPAAAAALERAEAGEVDDSPIQIRPRVAPYTRRHR